MHTLAKLLKSWPAFNDFMREMLETFEQPLLNVVLLLPGIVHKFFIALIGFPANYTPFKNKTPQFLYPILEQSV